MKRLGMNRIGVLVASLAVVSIAACSDSADPVMPNGNGAAGAATNGTSGKDSSKTGGTDSSGKTGGKSDTSGTHNPPPPPASTYTLGVHVGTPRAGNTDTLSNDPVANATVTVKQRVVVATGKTGADSVSVTDTDVATLVTTADGNVAFSNLKSNTSYVVTATPPAGSSLQPATQLIVYQGTSSNPVITMLLRRP